MSSSCASKPSRRNRPRASGHSRSLCSEGEGVHKYPQTDTSDRGLGAILSEVVVGEECPVPYISWKLSVRETKYSTIEKECLAFKWVVLTL
ncbi:hypothetical protein PGIGA_G00033150 [Pangasianodon gigas]|uniref:Uncharacterized protein n=1 Tax=Pangasianodon gigas TaxID=30993 RepID=A0ACC5WYK8_PANGG|nr:hypothetical protein [Pangasianodon gigas]